MAVRSPDKMMAACWGNAKLNRNVVVVVSWEIAVTRARTSFFVVVAVRNGIQFIWGGVRWSGVRRRCEVVVVGFWLFSVCNGALHGPTAHKNMFVYFVTTPLTYWCLLWSG